MNFTDFYAGITDLTPQLTLFLSGSCFHHAAAVCTLPCQNGGTCASLTACRCLSGFTGSHCQTGILPIDYCAFWCVLFCNTTAGPSILEKKINKKCYQFVSLKNVIFSFLRWWLFYCVLILLSQWVQKFATGLTTSIFLDPLPTSFVSSVALNCTIFALENGRLSTTVRKTGTVVELSCNRGYQLKGSERVTCLGNQQWSSPLPVCEGMYLCACDVERSCTCWAQ